MNRDEVKELLKKRDRLFKSYQELESIVRNAENLSNSMINDIGNARTNINNALDDIDNQLLKYVKESPVGEWLLQIKGITPDLAAALLAYFDIKNKECANQFISYSGIDNYDNKPHNNDVRNIIDKIGCNFRIEPESLYGRLYKDKIIELLNGENEIPLFTIKIRAIRHMQKTFVAHLFDKMYIEEHGRLPERHNNDDLLIIEPEVPYTK